MTTGTEQTGELIDTLEATLQRQIDAARNSNFRQLDQLILETGPIITEIAQKKLFQKPQFSRRGDDITKLCQKLDLMVITNKESIVRQRRKIAKGKKTIQAYKHGS